MKTAIVIPARYASTRFPGKPLVSIAGVAMIERVYRQASRCKLATEVLVATDDQRIASFVTGFGGKVVMTGSQHPSGTDRLAEVAARFADLDIIVNVQGDEPLISPDTIDAAIAPLLADTSLEMSTIASPINDAREITSPTVVKVVVDGSGKAVYFSRAAIPFYRDQSLEQKYRAHVGLYVYRRETLLRLASLSPTALEQAESLEQLRALEHGIAIRVVDVRGRTPAVDVPEDVAIVEDWLAQSTVMAPVPQPGLVI